MDLLAVGHHRVPRQGVVVFPACQLANPARLAVDGVQTRAVPLAPDHALVICRRYFAAPLDQGTVGIKKQLSVVQSSAVTLVNADRRNSSGLLASVADGARRR